MCPSKEPPSYMLSRFLGTDPSAFTAEGSSSTQHLISFLPWKLPSIWGNWRKANLVACEETRTGYHLMLLQCHFTFYILSFDHTNINLWHPLITVKTQPSDISFALIFSSHWTNIKTSQQKIKTYTSILTQLHFSGSCHRC